MSNIYQYFKNPYFKIIFLVITYLFFIMLALKIQQPNYTDNWIAFIIAAIFIGLSFLKLSNIFKIETIKVKNDIKKKYFLNKLNIYYGSIYALIEFIFGISYIIADNNIYLNVIAFLITGIYCLRIIFIKIHFNQLIINSYYFNNKISLLYNYAIAINTVMVVMIFTMIFHLLA